MIYDIYNERLVLVLVWFMRSGFSRMLISQLNSRCYPYAMLSGSVVQVETPHSPNNKQTTVPRLLGPPVVGWSAGVPGLYENTRYQCEYAQGAEDIPYSGAGRDPYLISSFV